MGINKRSVNPCRGRRKNNSVIHPKKWMAYSQEIAMTRTEMETTAFSPVVTEYSKLLTNLRLKIKTSYNELSINSLITIGRETFTTSPMLLCHLDAKELYDSLTTFAYILNSTDGSLSSSSANTTTMSTLSTPVCRQTKLVGVHGSSAVQISEIIDGSTFEDAFMRATSEVTTSRPLYDIFVRVAKKVYFPGADETLHNQIRNIFISKNILLYNLLFFKNPHCLAESGLPSENVPNARVDVFFHQSFF